MVTTCFFCQNLLSDFIEGLLPNARQEELKSHLDTCKQCSGVHDDLESTLKLLHAMPSKALSHDMALRIAEASHAGHARIFSRVNLSRTVLFLLVPILLFFGAASMFPGLFPWYTRWRSGADLANFVRYYPLLAGASEILDDQASWLHAREPFMRSVWEEGGLSPEEFEKAFQINKGAKFDEGAAPAGAGAATVPAGGGDD